MDRGEMELIVLDQRNAGLDAAKIHGYAVDNGVQEDVEIEDGTNLLCRLLQRHQDVHAALLEDLGRRRSRRRMAGSAWHKKPPLHHPLDSGLALRMRKGLRDELRPGNLAVIRR
jgi:hypothetical protein